MDGFNFDIPTTADNNTANRDQLNNISEVHQLHPAEHLTSNQSDNRQVILDISSNYTSISELLQDEQMFRLDQDPQVFQINSEDLNSSLGLEDMKDIESVVLSQDYIPPAEDIFSELAFFSNDLMDDKNKEIDTPTLSPLPAPPSPYSNSNTAQQTSVVATITNRNDHKMIKMETDDDKDFDLIEYINSGEVSSVNDDKFYKFLNIFFSPHQFDSVALTPVEEKACPSFDVSQPAIKIEPEPSTSAASSRKPSVIETDHSYEHRPKRIIKRRRYSSDSDYSIGTSASSYNSTKQKIHKRRRGRPAKELITNLPTINDFNHLPVEAASHLVLRIKNNEASRKSRMKSKNQQQALEDQCSRLENRQQYLKQKKLKYEAQIEQLRKWLLGVH